MIERVLREAGADRADITKIVCGVGPGPFTGLRVGLTSALVLGRALGVQVVGVCSLDIIAAEVAEAGPFAVTADAKRKELYWAKYENGVRVSGPAVATPADVSAGIAGLPVAGAGPVRYPEHFANSISPTGATVIGLTRVAVRPGSWLEPGPLYLREPDAVASGQRKPVTPGGVR